jgi:hypothetical protein
MKLAASSDTIYIKKRGSSMWTMRWQATVAGPTRIPPSPSGARLGNTPTAEQGQVNIARCVIRR